VIKLHNATVESFTYITYELARMPNLKVNKLTASDKPRINSYSSGVYGIQPSFFNVTGE
jgi:hypothetical protein